MSSNTAQTDKSSSAHLAALLQAFAERQIALLEDLRSALKLELEALQHIQPQPAAQPTEEQKAKELDTLEWKNFNKGNGNWVKTADAPEWLVQILQIKKQFDLGGFTYKLSGDSLQFVNRFHVKKV